MESFKKFVSFSYLSLCLVGHQSIASEYVITTVEGVSNQNLIRAAQRNLSCRQAFAIDIAAVGSARVQRTASYRMDRGVVDRSTRGQQLQESAIENMSNYSSVIVSRLLYDWRASGRYSPEALEKIFELHRSLSPYRLKMISVEDSDAANISNYLDPNGAMVYDPSRPDPKRFSAIRIYDSSPVMKIYGLRYQPPELSSKDTLEIAERVFPNFDLEQALSVNNMTRSEYTWSLGLVDVSGKQDGALQTLVANVADLLDLHYNRRDYLNFKQTDFILSEDVDVVFYGSRAIKVYYKKLFGFEPLNDDSGEPLVFKKNGQEFYVFNIKGSELIKKTLDFRYSAPLYGNDAGLRHEGELREYLIQEATRNIIGLNPDDYRPRDFLEFVRMLKPIVFDFAKLQRGESDPLSVQSVGRFLLLRRQLPDDLFHASNDKLIQKGLEELVYLGEAFPELNLEITGDAGLLGSIMYLDILLRDPMTFMINSGNFTKVK